MGNRGDGTNDENPSRRLWPIPPEAIPPLTMENRDQCHSKAWSIIKTSRVNER
jgi:hypothetical protein